MNDTGRIEWLEKQTRKGGCPALVYDDNGHWALSWTGMQNVVTGKNGEEVRTSVHVPAKAWKPSIRKAIDAAIKEGQAGGEHE